MGEFDVPMKRLKDYNTMRVTLDLKDLGMVTFPTTVNPARWGSNHSNWIDQDHGDVHDLWGDHSDIAEHGEGVTIHEDN